MFRKNSGFSISEYVIITALVLAALTAMNIYIKRGVQGRIKDLADYNINAGKPVQENEASPTATTTGESNQTTETDSRISMLQGGVLDSNLEEEIVGDSKSSTKDTAGAGLKDGDGDFRDASDPAYNPVPEPTSDPTQDPVYRDYVDKMQQDQQAQEEAGAANAAVKTQEGKEEVNKTSESFGKAGSDECGAKYDYSPQVRACRKALKEVIGKMSW